MARTRFRTIYEGMGKLLRGDELLGAVHCTITEEVLEGPQEQQGVPEVDIRLISRGEVDFIALSMSEELTLELKDGRRIEGYCKGNQFIPKGGFMLKGEQKTK